MLTKKVKLISLATAVLLTGCSASRPTVLQQARDNLQKAQQDSQLATNAQLPLYEAAQTYERAEAAWKDGADDTELRHLAYLTNQKIQIAQQTAQQKIAEAESQRLASERERVVLEARTREAEQAKRLAEASAREAEILRQQAQMSGQEAQLAQKQAEARARELEAVRQQSEASMREVEQARQQAEAAAAQNKKLEEQLADLKARQTARGLELTLSSVLFDFDKAALKPGAERGLTVLVEFLKANQDRRLVIEGHTDSLGADSYNLQLSQQRADAVRAWFVQRGVSAERIAAQGLGESYPIAANDSESGRQENRRVQIIISAASERAAGRQ
jgi:outer membrane protein OmpA-like peptidoglycan-associated protein